MINKKEGGMALLNLIIILIIVGLIAFIAWRGLDSATQQNNQQKANGNQAQAIKNSNEGFIIINEWGLRFKPVNNLTGVIYKIGQQKETNDTIAVFSTQALSQYGENCSANVVGHWPLGVLKRFTTPNDQTKANPTTKHIGNYYYVYVTPQTFCSDTPNPPLETLQTKTIELFKISIGSLEPIK